MDKTEYRNYIASADWQKRRKEFLRSCGEECNRCFIPRWLAEIAYDQDLHVHHKSYANLGSERWEDLEPLCRRCHDIETFGHSKFREIRSYECDVCGSTHWNPRTGWCAACDMAICGGVVTPKLLEIGKPRDLDAHFASTLGEYIGTNNEDIKKFTAILQNTYEHYLGRSTETT